MKAFYIGDIAVDAMGLFLILASIVTFIKIYKGSKVPFAFTMVIYTCLYGITFIVLRLNLISLFSRTWYDDHSSQFLYLNTFFRCFFFWIST